MNHPELTLFQAHPDPMWLRDGPGERMLAVNAAALRVYGYTEAEFLALAPDALSVPLETPDYPDWARSSAVVSELHRLASGAWLPVSVLERPVRHDGQDAVLVVARDVSPWVALERENRQLRGNRMATGAAGGPGAPADQLRLLETAMSWVNDVVMITEARPLDPPGPRIVFVNDAFEQRTGYSRDEALGRTPRLLQGPDTQRGELDRIRQALEDERPVRVELVNYTRDGQRFLVELDIAPIRDESGHVSHFVAVQRDVTEQRALEEQLERSQRLDAIGQLTGGVAHDFNNLLTVILGNADLLADAVANDRRLLSLVSMTRTAAERGAELTRRLLAFARRQALDPSPTDIDGLLRGMYELLRRTLGEQIEIDFVPGHDTWEAMVDASQLESALLNLCLNARDAMPAGGRLEIRTANVSLSGSEQLHRGEVTPGDYVMISVADSGFGMPAEIVRHAFEPFFTTKETGKGSGLGLSMVYGFIKQSAGHVRLESVPGAGTTVTLYLPRAPHAAATGTVSGPRRAVVGGRERILVVEDDAIVRAFVEDQLRGLGYDVVTAATGPEALGLLESAESFDLLFTDMVMPGGMNGRDLADAARALRPHLPVLFTSGYTDTGVVHEGRLDSDVELLQKPYRRADLAGKIRQALSGGQRR